MVLADSRSSLGRQCRSMLGRHYCQWNGSDVSVTYRWDVGKVSVNGGKCFIWCYCMAELYSIVILWGRCKRQPYIERTIFVIILIGILCCAHICTNGHKVMTNSIKLHLGAVTCTIAANTRYSRQIGIYTSIRPNGFPLKAKHLLDSNRLLYQITSLVMCRSHIGEVLVLYQWSVSQVSGNYRPSIGEILVKCRLSIGDTV